MWTKTAGNIAFKQLGLDVGAIGSSTLSAVVGQDK